MSVHRSGSWHEQSRMGTFLRTGPRFHETSSSIISDRSKLVDRFAGSWHYLTPLPSLSLSLCTRATGSRFSRLRRTTSTCRNPRSFRPRNERCACAGFLLPFIVGKNLSFTDKVSWFNGTPLMRDILVDREISTTWSLGELPWGEHAVCPVRFFSFLLSFSHSVW